MSISKTNSTVVKSHHDNSKFGSGVKVISGAVRFKDYVVAPIKGGIVACSPSKPPVGCGSSNQVKINK